MNAADERRNPHVNRVDLTTLVDICAADGSASPFQGESTNVSGRGMLVKTSHLPELGEGLVCRFEHAGHEILVEGAVAWRSESEDGGEFGIKFTALDADCADILGDLGRRAKSPVPPATALLDDEEEDDDDPVLSSGSRVRLHIDGLGAPMKASVHEGSDRRLRVGSNLEFLKIGQALEIESLEGEEQRGATIDSVNVVLNPSTSVPELVVQLRYEGISPTPAPVGVAVSADVAASAAAGLDFDDDAFGHSDEDEDEEAEEVDVAGWQPSADVLQQRLGDALGTASSAASKATTLLKGALSRAKESAADRGLTTFPKMPISLSREPSENAAPSAAVSQRRVQGPRARTRAPAHLRSGIHDMGLTSDRPRRATTRPSAASTTEAPRRSKAARLGLLGGALILVLGSAAALRGFSSDAEVADAPALSKAVPVEGAESSPAPAAAAAPARVPKKAAHPDGIAAEVPLFGARAVAAPEAAPAGDGLDDAAAEKLAAAAAVEDQSWDEETKPKAVDSSKPWGRGRLHLPTIHRIRLDGPGAEIAGVVESSGFTVVIPGRKAMESGRSIQKRDKRIVKVKASNTSQGARIGFSFRGSVPPYRVRLRKDFIEFLISAPEDGVAQL